MQGLKGLATGVGSLPHKDADSALDLIFKSVPQAPFWPQLPKRDLREGMVAQFIENLPCIQFAKSGLVFNAVNKDKELERFYEHIIANDVDYFKISPDYAIGLHEFYKRLEHSDLKGIEFIKLQVTGPFTFAASIKDDMGAALLHDPVFMQVIIKGLIMKALWQIKLFRKFGKKIMLFFDEPYLGCFGSAYTPINRGDVVKGLTEIAEGIKSKDVLVGLHCCGNTDWSIFTDVAPIEMINFDAFSFLDKLVLYAENLKAYLKKGGLLCWGIVPTQEFIGRETAASSIKKIQAGIEALEKKGLDRELVSRNLMISPSCGLGTLDSQKAEQIFGLLQETSALIKKSL
jgi:methionine synthase II (cobalamin-independent)